MSELIMAIDPGETTGWAFGRASARAFKLEAHGEVNAEEVLGDVVVTKYGQYKAATFTLMGIVNELQPQVVIVEDFVLRQFTTMKQEGISPARIGAMLVVWLEEIMPHEKGFEKLRVVWQTPSQMAVVTNERMRTQMSAAYAATRGFPHARDAVRHCEVYRRKLSG